MTDNEKLARWQGWEAYKSKYGHWIVTSPDGTRHEDGYGLPLYDSISGEPLVRSWSEKVEVPDYHTDSAAAMSLLDTLVELGHEPELSYHKDIGEWQFFTPCLEAGVWGKTHTDCVTNGVLEVINGSSL